MIRKHYPYGSVICGTLCPEDLIPALITELSWQGPLRRRVRVTLRLIEQNSCPPIEHPDYYAGEECQFDLEWLTNRLQEKAGPFMYFGVSPGNSSDFGFWLQEDWEQELEDDGGIKVSDLSDVPPDFTGYVAVVNDHGNVSLYEYRLDSRYRRHKVLHWELV